MISASTEQKRMGDGRWIQNNRSDESFGAGVGIDEFVANDYMAATPAGLVRLRFRPRGELNNIYDVSLARNGSFLATLDCRPQSLWDWNRNHIQELI